MSFVVELVSSPDRDELVADIWWNEQMVAELRQTDGARHIDLYPAPSRRPWSFKLEDWLAAIENAQSRLGRP